MNETFDLPVSYIGKELSFPAKLLVFGYSYKIAVDLNGIEIIFEPDEERNYRVLVDPEKLEGKKMDIELLKAIAVAIEGILK